MFLLIVLGILLFFNLMQIGQRYFPIPKAITGKVLNLDTVVTVIAFVIQLVIVTQLRL